MADSYIIYTASGATDIFNIPFGYLDPEHVLVSVDNVDVDFTFPSESQVQLDAGNPANGAKVKVYRVTPRDSREVVWSNAANLTAGDLNTADLQMLYISQEAFDTIADAILKDDSGIFDAASIRIQNVATPTQDGDAANKEYVDGLTSDFVDDAEAARDAAEGHATDAAAALAACQAVYDNFDDRYLGQKAAAPTLDNDGNALIDGALYYNTTDNKMYVYDLGTTTWLAIETNIGNDSVTNAKLDNMAQATIKGRAAGGGTGDPQDLTAAQVRTILSVLPSIDEDTMSSNSDTAVPTQQSVKAYVDGNIKKRILGTAYASTSALDSTTNVLPIDDTIPQSGEGDEAITVTYTRQSATSKLVIEAGTVLTANGNLTAAIALFQDATANALTASAQYIGAANISANLSLKHEMVSGATGATTFKLRYGGQAGTIYLNGFNAARVFGGVANTYIRVTEVEA